MEIAIRPRLDRAAVEALVRDRLGADLEFTAHEEFTDGYFNAAHALDLADGRRLVVKVAPDAGLKLQRYEVDLMATEIECFERALAVGVPMPKVWHADPEGGVLIIDRLTGVSFPSVRDDFTEAQRLVLRREIGALSARYAAVTGERFGYPRKSGRTGAATWSASFQVMVDDALADIADYEVPLPRPAEAISAMVRAEAALLDEVTRPALVHFDLWDGNIFVRLTEDGPRVEAFIDGERAFYGDPIAELTSMTMFIPAEEVPAVLDGFLGRALDAGEERRLVLYRVYLWLLLMGEAGFRGYEDKDAIQRHQWVWENLIEEFALLDS